MGRVVRVQVQVLGEKSRGPGQRRVLLGLSSSHYDLKQFIDYRILLCRSSIRLIRRLPNSSHTNPKNLVPKHGGAHPACSCRSSACRKHPRLPELVRGSPLPFKSDIAGHEKVLSHVFSRCNHFEPQIDFMAPSITPLLGSMEHHLVVGAIRDRWRNVSVAREHNVFIHRSPRRPQAHTLRLKSRCQYG